MKHGFPQTHVDYGLCGVCVSAYLLGNGLAARMLELFLGIGGQ